MAFWATTTGTENYIEPNRQHRWAMTLSGGDFSKVIYGLKKASKPTVKISEIQHKYLNHHYYYPGRMEWEPISVTFAAVKIDATSIADYFIYTLLASTGYMYPTGAPAATDSAQENLKTISKTKAIKALTNGGLGTKVELFQIDEEGKQGKKWFLYNPFFTDVKYDSLEYGSEEILNIDCTIKYDYATLNSAEAVLAK